MRQVTKELGYGGTMYYIKWQSRITGNVGQGEPVFTNLASAQKEIKRLDKEYPEIEHWAELANKKPEEVTK